jgi:hypothetical protein
VVHWSTWKVTLFLVCAYTATFLAFAVAFFLIREPCDLDFDDAFAVGFVEALYVSTETIATIGYGAPNANGNPALNGCVEGVFVVVAASIAGVLLDAVFVSLFFVRISRPQPRASTLLFSERATIRCINGALRFVFRVVELRKHQLVESHVRLYAIQNSALRSGASGGGRVAALQMRTTLPDDEYGACLFLMLPSYCVHTIDASSPLLPGRSSSSNSSGKRSEWEEAIAAGDFEQQHAIVQRHIEATQLEVVVVIESIDAITSATFQARHSYVVAAGEIVVEKIFQASSFRDAKTGVCEVDLEKFHALEDAREGVEEIAAELRGLPESVDCIGLGS